MNEKGEQVSNTFLSRSFSTPDSDIRQISTLEEFEACVKLQRDIWGSSYRDCVPTTVLKVSQKMGGLVAGAFDEKRLLGFVFGITGLRGGEVAHWSHMLAVRKEARRKGLAKLLKLYQREFLLRIGVKSAFWTYDPLVARNANLNINSLGARVTEYVKDMYAEGGSELHQGLGMDRFIMAWHLNDESVRQILSGRKTSNVDQYASSPVVNTVAGGNGVVVLVGSDQPFVPNVRIEVPTDVEAIQSSDLDLGGRWRANTRDAFMRYMKAGYAVEAFYIDPQSHRCFYCLARTADTP